LIPWAAYNNLPEVLKKYAEAGVFMNEVDANGNTPIDLAIINKCYESVEVLAKFGLRPKQSLL
jgi:ankyrin repeat protein